MIKGSASRRKSTRKRKQRSGSAAFSVDQFCVMYGVSRTFVYSMWKRGIGPRAMKVGRRTLISAEAAADWRSKLEGGAQ